VAARESTDPPWLAATPGKSNHGWGLAVDLGDGIQNFGTPQHEWIRANASRYGWVLPAWAQENGSRPGPWHFEYMRSGGGGEPV
jgi:LAS superfamily LD-carboxypeptidase LdcB